MIALTLKHSDQFLQNTCLNQMFKISLLYNLTISISKVAVLKADKFYQKI